MKAKELQTEYEACCDKIVLVVNETTDKVTSGGIVLPASVQPRQRRGRVLSFGPDVKTKLTIGDQVLFNIHAGAPTADGDREILVIAEKELFDRIVK